MKALSLKTMFAVAALFSAVTLSSASDKTSEKAREAVENADPNDWNTLAKSAEKCLKKKVNLEQANEWLKRSILIQKNEYNLTLKGDYHRIVGEPDIACEYYLEALKVVKKQDPKADLSAIQKKIYKARKQLY